MSGKRVVIEGPMPDFEEMIRAIGPLTKERSRELSEAALGWVIGQYPERAEEFRRRMEELLAIEDKVREEKAR